MVLDKSSAGRAVTAMAGHRRGGAHARRRDYRRRRLQAEARRSSPPDSMSCETTNVEAPSATASFPSVPSSRVALIAG